MSFLGKIIQSVIGVAEVAIGIVTLNPAFVVAGSLTIASAILSKTPKKPKLGGGSSTEPRGITVASASATHKPLLGQTSTAFTLTWFEKTADGKLYTLYTGPPHAIATFGPVYFDDVEVIIDAAGNAITPVTFPDGTTPKSYVGVVRMVSGNGTVTGDAGLHSFLTARCQTWTADCKQDGRCKLAIEWTYNKDILTGALPNVTAIINGYLCFDTRAATKTITTSSVATPSVIETSAAHGRAVGDFVFIRSHAGSVPPLSGAYEVGTVPSSTTLTLLSYSQDLGVSTGGTGGTLSAMAWTDNPVCLGVTYICDKVYGLPSVFEDEFVESQVTDAANTCDEYVTRATPTATFTAVAATDLITYALTGTAGDLPDYAQVTVASSTTLPAGLAAATVYYFKSYSAAGQGYLCSSLANAQAVPPVPVNITSTGTGTHTLTMVMTFTATITSGYSNSNALELYSSAFRILTGDKCQVSTTNTLPSGLVAATDYYAIFVTDRRIRLAITLSNARDGIAITLASAGTGVHSITTQAELRYTANGIVDSASDVKSIIDAIAETTAGDFVAAGASLAFYPGVYRTPTITLTDDDLRGPIALQRLISAQDSFNSVKGSYFDPHGHFMPADFPSYKSSTYVTADNGETVWGDNKYELINSPFKASRVARIGLEKIRRERTLTRSDKFTAFRNQVGDVVQVTNTALGLSSATYELRQFGFSLSPDANGVPSLNVDSVLRQTDSSVYSWSSTNETGAKRFSPVGSSSDVLTAPTGLTVSVNGGYATILWNAIPNARVAGYGIVDAPLSGAIGDGRLLDGLRQTLSLTIAVADGNHTFFVYGVDTAGNAGPAASYDVSGATGGVAPLVTHIYTGGSVGISGDEPVPAGVTSLDIVLRGTGGGNGANGKGGGGGGYSIRTVAIDPADWGTTLAWVVGGYGIAGYYDYDAPGYVNGTQGETSTVISTLTNWSGTMTANGGNGAPSNSSSFATGGTASGGTTNTTGGTSSGTVGGDAAGAGGGTGGLQGYDGNTPGGGAGALYSYTVGGAGQVEFYWT